MIYATLLRGINVGGKNKIDMKLLQETFVRIGMRSVVTYINSGNAIFADMQHTKVEITTLLEKAISEDFQLEIKVFVLSINDFDHMMRILPKSWKNDKDMKCDVLFLWDEVDGETLLRELEIKPNIDTVIYAHGAVLWAVDKCNVTKSGLLKLVGTSLYKNMTVRNVNTTRKLYEIMKELHLNSMTEG